RRVQGDAYSIGVRARLLAGRAGTPVPCNDVVAPSRVRSRDAEPFVVVLLERVVYEVRARAVADRDAVAVVPDDVVAQLRGRVLEHENAFSLGAKAVALERAAVDDDVRGSLRDADAVVFVLERLAALDVYALGVAAAHGNAVERESGRSEPAHGDT